MSTYIRTCTSDDSCSKSHYQIFLLDCHGFVVCVTSILLHQHENRTNYTEATKVNEEEPQETITKNDRQVDATEAFKVCHTSMKNGMSDTAREAVVSPYTS